MNEQHNTHTLEKVRRAILEQMGNQQASRAIEDAYVAGYAASALAGMFAGWDTPASVCEALDLPAPVPSSTQRVVRDERAPRDRRTSVGRRAGDRDLAREKALDNAYTDNDLLWALARKRVAAEIDLEGENQRYVAEAVEMAYDDLRDRFEFLNVLTREDWLAGLSEREADRSLEVA